MIALYRSGVVNNFSSDSRIVAINGKAIREPGMCPRVVRKFSLSDKRSAIFREVAEGVELN